MPEWFSYFPKMWYKDADIPRFYFFHKINNTCVVFAQANRSSRHMMQL